MKLSTITGISIAMFAVASLAYPLDTAFANTTTEIQSDLNPEDDIIPTVNCSTGNGLVTLVLYGKSDINQTFDAQEIDLTKGDSIQALVASVENMVNPIPVDIKVKKVITQDDVNGDQEPDAVIKMSKADLCDGITENYETEEKTQFEAFVTVTTLDPPAVWSAFWTFEGLIVEPYNPSDPAPSE